MKKIIAIMIALAVSGGVAHAELTKEQAVEKSKAMVMELGGGLKAQLQEAVKKSGFPGAIEVCKSIGQVKAKEVSEKHKASIRRVSEKPRNTANVPDEFEKSMLSKMEQDHKAGSMKEAYVEIVTAADGKKSMRFMKPVVTEKLCLNCHGTQETLNKDAVKKIAEMYPDDKATGYSENQVRGAFTVIYPMN